MSGDAWYFAYGSNLDPERLRARVGEWSGWRRARLDGWQLRFSDRVQSEGGGGAVAEPCADAVVHGAVFRLSAEQLAAMDAVELDPERDLSALGIRRTVRVHSEGETVEAEIYTLREGGGDRAPSPRYLGHILHGLEAVGHPEMVIERVRAIAAAAAATPSSPTDR